MVHKLSGPTTLLAYAALSWLLPWGWSDNVDLAGGVVVLMASALAFSVGSVALLVFMLSRPRSSANAMHAARAHRPVSVSAEGRAKRVILPLSCITLGILLLASLFYVDYYLLQRTIVFLVGLLLCGSGAALLLTPRLARRADRSDVSIPVTFIALGLLLVASVHYAHYYPAQRAMMLGEGIAFLAVGAAVLVRAKLEPTTGLTG